MKFLSRFIENQNAKVNWNFSLMESCKSKQEDSLMFKSWFPKGEKVRKPRIERKLKEHLI